MDLTSKSRARDGMPTLSSFLGLGAFLLVSLRGMRNKMNSLPWKMNRFLSVPCVLTAWKERMVSLPRAKGSRPVGGARTHCKRNRLSVVSWWPGLSCCF